MSVLLVNILETFLGDVRHHNEDTGQISFDCPACSDYANKPEGDGKGNLEINYEKGIFRCWSCQEINDMSGPVMKLLKRYANTRLIRDYILVKPETATKQERKHVIITYPEGFKRLSNCTSKDFKSEEAKQYLYDRGITDEIIKEYNIGYTYKGKYYNRVIVPSYDAEGKLNYFVARWFSKTPNRYKYNNPEADKEELIFNENKINWDEGVTDHIVIPNSIPLLGKFMTKKLKDLLHEKAKAKIVVVLDDDAHEDAIRLYKELNFCDLLGRILVCLPEEGDPSSIFQKSGYKGIVNLLRTAKKFN
jgi:DNA primase